MNETRAIGQEIQDQVLAAARKGQQRVTSTVKTVTATAQQIRPQLPSMPNLPRPTLNVSGLPTPAQLRERAPQLAALLPTTEQLRAGAHELRANAHEFAGQFMSVQRKVVDQVRSASAPLTQQAESHDLAGQFLSVQRKVVEQVRSVATPLAHEAAAVFTQVSRPGSKTTTPAALSDDAAPAHAKADTSKTGTSKASTSKADTSKADTSKTEHGKTGHGKTGPRRGTTSKTDAGKADAKHDVPGARKPRTRSTAK
jgi:hypothetical protein